MQIVENYNLVKFEKDSPFYFWVITIRNSSCGKVMFSQMSVCPQGECTPPTQTHPCSRHPTWADTLGKHPPVQTSPPGQIPPWADTPLGRSPIQTSPLGRPPQSDSHCCRQYASYWNAFLLNNKVGFHAHCNQWWSLLTIGTMKLVKNLHIVLIVKRQIFQIKILNEISFPIIIICILI